MLENHIRHESRDPEETLAFLAAKGLRARLKRADASCAAPTGQGFQARIAGAYSDRFYLAHMSYDAALEIDAPAEKSDYGFSVVCEGGMNVTERDAAIRCSRDATALSSPGVSQRIALDPDAKRLAVSISRSAVRRRLATLTGAVPKEEIVFEPRLALDKGVGRMAVAQIECAIEEEDRNGGFLSNPLRVAQFEDALLSSLLLFQPHNHTHLLEARPRAPHCRDVRRVMEYIEANLAEPLRLEDLVAVSGVSGRALNEHFQKTTGLSPMAWLRRMRLEEVRRVLLDDEAVTVTEAALRFGFSHLGRFAASYRAEFGEAPSETCRQASGAGLVPGRLRRTRN